MVENDLYKREDVACDEQYFSNGSNSEGSPDYLKDIRLRLDQQLLGEFQAINQYMIDSKILEFDGIDWLSKKFEEESLEEREHVSLLAMRSLTLGGMPDFEQIGEIKYTRSIREMLTWALKLECDGIRGYRDAIALAENNNDYKTADMLTGILVDEEGHKLWLEEQIRLFDLLGEALYIVNGGKKCSD